MISPNVRSNAPHEITENASNGNGYWSFTPGAPAVFSEQAPAMAEFGTFLELRDVVSMAAEHGSVLVHGAPGAGKSHLVRELQTSAVVNNVPTFCLTTHVNLGKRSGIDNIREPLQQFRDVVGDGQGLIILDNVDMLGYKGGSRRRVATTEHTTQAQALFGQLIDDPHFAVVGTAHTDEWRAARWTWDDPQIDVPARQALEAFDSHLTFEGNMALVGLAHIMHNRGYRLGVAARAIRNLHAAGQANFFYANHVDPDLYLENPQAAIQAVEAGRRERIEGSSSRQG